MPSGQRRPRHGSELFGSCALGRCRQWLLRYPVDIPATSPATRAKWILTRFLGVNPPTPLPSVPPKHFPFEKDSPLGFRT